MDIYMPNGAWKEEQLRVSSHQIDIEAKVNIKLCEREMKRLEHFV